MAVQAGVWFFDGRPVTEQARAIEASLVPLAPDGARSWLQQGIVLGFGACHVWTGEEGCAQPLHTAADLVVTWDGRIDNRDDLLLRLGGTVDDGRADAEIAAAVFERWGSDGLRAVIGDWSMAIWNRRSRVLHLARDYMGVRPLYYHLDRDAVMWSTSLGELAIRSGRVDDLNDAFVARFMTLQFSTDVTPYVGIRAVPSATCVTISPRGSETRQRFWDLAPGTIRYRDVRDYEVHLRRVWAEAVGTRLRTRGTVWAELSGGLDSSSVVCMAAALINGGRVPAAALKTVAHVTFDSLEGDERRFVQAVDDWTGIGTELIGVEAHADASIPEWSWVTPLAPRGVKAVSLRHAAQSGARVVLTGRMGDGIMGCEPDNSAAVFDDLAERHVGTALVKLRRWSRSSRKPFIELAGKLALAVSRIEAAQQPIGDRTLTMALRRQIPARAVANTRNRVRAAARGFARTPDFYAEEGRLESWTSSDCVWESHPFSHRPLIDYMLSVPGEELSAPLEIRSLMRRAFAGIVPDRILRRVSKGHYAPDAYRTVREECEALPPLATLECVRRGWIDTQRLAAAVNGLRSGDADAFGDVRGVLSLERWLISRHRRGPAAIPNRKEVITNDVRIA